MPEPRESEELVRVATAPNTVIAASWREVLRAEGILSFVRIDDPLGVAYNVSSPYPCGIFVLASEAERARELLDELAGDGALIE